MDILVTGSSGFIGRNICETFSDKHNLLTPTHRELDLLDENAVRIYIKNNNPDIILHCANRGGERNTLHLPDAVGYNTRIFFNLIRNSHLVKKIIYFGTGAEYGKHKDIINVREEEFDVCVPKDDYGFYKYTFTKFIERYDNIINLRLFGIFGKYENYDYKFISNAIIRNMLGLEMNLGQNLVTDYIYINDLMSVLDFFIKKTPKSKVYNVTSGVHISLLDICSIISKISAKPSKTNVLKPGLNYEYTADNSRLVKELDGYKFTAYEIAIRDLFYYYKQNIDKLDKDKCAVNAYLSTYSTR